MTTFDQFPSLKGKGEEWIGQERKGADWNGIFEVKQCSSQTRNRKRTRQRTTRKLHTNRLPSKSRSCIPTLLRQLHRRRTNNIRTNI